MGSTRFKLGKGYYTLDGFRFYYDPDPMKNKGKYMSPSYVKIKTQSAVVIQSWDSVEGDNDQVFRWNNMPTEFYDELDERYQETLTTAGTTHELQYHDADIDEIWNVFITNLEGDFRKGTWWNISLSFTILDQVVSP